jgi:hypothetical protein
MGLKDSGLAERIGNLNRQLTTIEETLYQTKSKSGQDPLNYPVRLNDKLSGLIGTVTDGPFKPTKSARDVYAKLNKELEVEMKKLRALFGAELKAINNELQKLGLERVTVPEPKQGSRSGGFGEALSILTMATP